MFVKPAAGAILPDPDHGYEPLPSEGRDVPESDFWLRRLRDGDVFEANAPKIPAVAPAVEV
jgi:hypothetical protein